MGGMEGGGIVDEVGEEKIEVRDWYVCRCL